MSNRQASLKLNREDRRFLGVCAGIADYLDVPAAVIRVIFVICVLTWPTMILAYFLCYFCMDRNITSEKIQDFFNNNIKPGNFNSLNLRRPIFRNMRHRRIAGVCAGIADYLEVSSFWVRASFIGGLIVFGPFAVLAYVVCWIAIEPNGASPRYTSRHARRQARWEHKRQRWERKKQRWEQRFYGDDGKVSSRININVETTNDPLYGEYDPDGESATGRANTENAARSSSANKAEREPTAAQNSADMQRCADAYYAMETRMREIEAFITSKRFRLHCEINRA